MWSSVRAGLSARSSSALDYPVQRFGVILAAKDCATIFPSRTTKVSVAASYELSAVSAFHNMYAYSPSTYRSRIENDAPGFANSAKKPGKKA